MLGASNPFTDQSGLAKTGGGRDECHAGRVLDAFVQPLNQPGAEDTIGLRWGNKKLGEQQGFRHSKIYFTPNALQIPGMTSC